MSTDCNMADNQHIDKERIKKVFGDAEYFLELL